MACAVVSDIPFLGAEFRNKERSLPHMREIDWKEPDGKPVGQSRAFVRAAGSQ